ncbi:MAG: TPM domain-containing protein [bacterium]|nr:TPM domain-containing protein [bacterium]
MFSFFRKILLLGLVFLPIAVFAYVSPGQPAGFVNDFAGVFNVGQRSALEEKLSNFSKTYGNEIAVAIVNDLGGDYIENYAVKLFQEWGIGMKGLDNGALILVAVNDREMRIEAGYGLEGSLTDAQSNYIVNNIMKPAFQAGNYYAGIDGAADKIISATQGEKIPSEKSSVNGSGLPLEDLFFFAIFIIMIVASVLGQSKSWWAGGVLGGIIGVIIGFVKGFLFFGLFSILALIPLGLFFDFLVSRSHAKHKLLGTVPWWIGRGRGPGGGGGFGGFGGGRSGGGGFSGRW